MPVDWSDINWREHFRIRYRGFKRGVRDWRLWIWMGPIILIPLPVYVVPLLDRMWKSHPLTTAALTLATALLWILIAWKPVRRLQDQYDGESLHAVGRCPHCGYDRRGDFAQPCTECGGA